MREQLLDDDRGPTAVQFVPGMAFLDRRPKVIAKRHGESPLPRLYRVGRCDPRDGRRVANPAGGKRPEPECESADENVPDADGDS